MIRTIVLDSQGLSSLAQNGSRLTWARLAWAVDHDQRVIVPAVVVTEVMTGRPTDAAVWHLLRHLVGVDTTIALAARAGALRERAELVRRKKRDLTIDAIVAATAIEYSPSVIVTSDIDDLSALVAGFDVRVVEALDKNHAE